MTDVESVGLGFGGTGKIAGFYLSFSFVLQGFIIARNRKRNKFSECIFGFVISLLMLQHFAQIILCRRIAAQISINCFSEILLCLLVITGLQIALSQLKSEIIFGFLLLQFFIPIYGIEIVANGKQFICIFLFSFERKFEFFFFAFILRTSIYR